MGDRSQNPTPSRWVRRYERRKVRGLCTRCGEVARDDATICEACTEAVSRLRQAWYVRTRRPHLRRCGRCRVVGHLRPLCKAVTR